MASTEEGTEERGVGDGLLLTVMNHRRSANFGGVSAQRLNGGLGSWYDLRWRIGILDQRDSSNALIYGWSTIKFDVKYQY